MASDPNVSVSSQELIQSDQIDYEHRYRLDQEGDQLVSDRFHSLNFDPLVSAEDLIKIAKQFVSSERITQANYFKTKFSQLVYDLKKHNENRYAKGLYPVRIQYLEHAHYIYSFKSEQMTQEELQLVRARESAFSSDDYPDEEVYKWVLKLIKVLSLLMVKWGIFDFNQYGYRYKGRSKTVRLLDIKKLNKQALSADILWFSFAISHQPFVGKISKIISSYAKVLQFAIDKIIMRLEIHDEKFENVSFDFVSRWQFRKKDDPWILELYYELRDLELAFREFEKHLIEEFLKII